MIEAPLDKVHKYVETFRVDKTVPAFLAMMAELQFPCAIVGDGFANFIEPLLMKTGIRRR